MMKTKSKDFTCYSCGKPEHKSFKCRSKLNKSTNNEKQKQWCNNCKSSTHDKQNVIKRVNNNNDLNSNEFHSFFFKVSISSTETVENIDVAKYLLVDSGATAYIVSDKPKFVKFDKNFNPSSHIMELADGSRTSDSALGRGDASVQIKDSNGKFHSVLFKNSLCIPSYKQNIFSVQAATESGATVNFSCNSNELVVKDGTIFEIEKHGKLYYLNSAKSTKQKFATLEEWH